MKKSQKILVVFSIITTLIVSSCTTDPCKDTSCSGNGTTTPSADNKSCSCICQTGYLGTNCSNVDMTKIAGKYEVTEVNSKNETTKYFVTVTVTGNNMLIANFANVFSNNVVISNVEGTIMSITSLTDIRGQKPDGTINYYVKTTENGSIKFVNGTPIITFIYQVTSPTGILSTFNCTYTKI
jgi:hypothetical protein